ncbi:MAG: phosphoglucosamine mutase [Bacteroidota bacterium]|nr:phosphoglucosamine mutase [Bacteroidota bacterium]MDP4229086.1 phosphoglucosamine mutase [Bacteroidota bacterium]MDP4235040.1 phosphoglucosamine mutase [Bacteroidota bacterium]
MLIRSISGLRGITSAPDGFTEEVATLYAQSFAAMLGNNGLVALGYDGRQGGKQYYEIIAEALRNAGCDVLGLLMVPTPTVMFAVETHTSVKGGISVTASHNGQEWNGMKFIARTGLFLDKTENEKLWALVDGGPKNHNGASGELIPGDEVKIEHVDSVSQIPFLSIEAIRSRNFKIILDAVNASGSFIVRELLTALGALDIIPLHADGSGVFPHSPEPVPQNLTELCEAVRREKADLGIAVDPDADRCVLIMDNGEPFIEENTIVLATEEVLRNSEKGQSVVVNLSTTRSVEDVAEKFGATVYRTPVGEINVAKQMRSISAVIGGEGSGGVIYPSVHTGRDSLVAIALVLNNLAFSNVSLSEKKKYLPQYEIVKSKIALENEEQVATILAGVRAKMSPEALKVNEEDGIRFDFEKSWLHVRASNTEPIIRLIAEAPTKEEAESILERAQ